jgi:hypothetical protein
MIEKVQCGESVFAVMNGLQEDGWNVLAVLSAKDGSGGLIIPGKNIVTNSGDLYYAQRGAGDTVTTDFTAGGLRLGTSNTSVTKTDTDVTTFGTGGGIVETSGYPKTNDTDADNSGAGTDIVTWKFSYATGEGNITGIQEGAIVNNITTPTAALSHFLFGASFNKTSDFILRVYVNHRFNGV